MRKRSLTVLSAAEKSISVWLLYSLAANDSARLVFPTHLAPSIRMAVEPSLRSFYSCSDLYALRSSPTSAMMDRTR